jgi:uncharacterized protein
MTALTKYKHYWEKKAVEEHITREGLRRDAMKTAAKMKDILVKEFSVSKVILFGSILEEGKFKEDSDIDLAVEGLSKSTYFEALARLIMRSPFAIDLKPLEDVSALLKKRIMRGRILYEKRKNP